MTTADLATLNLRPPSRPVSVLTSAQIEAKANLERARRQMLASGLGLGRVAILHEDDANEISAMLEEHESALDLLALIFAADALTPEHKAEAQTLLLHNS